MLTRSCSCESYAGAVETCGAGVGCWLASRLSGFECLATVASWVCGKSLLSRPPDLACLPIGDSCMMPVASCDCIDPAISPWSTEDPAILAIALPNRPSRAVQRENPFRMGRVRRRDLLVVVGKALAARRSSSRGRWLAQCVRDVRSPERAAGTRRASMAPLKVPHPGAYHGPLRLGRGRACAVTALP
eukprot:1195806-Prorocentrum_minimum.AAC.14